MDLPLKLEFWNAWKWLTRDKKQVQSLQIKEYFGVTTTITNEGTRPFAVDIQALVNKTFYSNRDELQLELVLTDYIKF